MPSDAGTSQNRNPGVPGSPIGQQHWCEPTRRGATAIYRAGVSAGAVRPPVGGISLSRKDKRGIVSAGLGTCRWRGARGGVDVLPVRIGDGRAGRSRRCAFPTTAFFEMPIRRPICAVVCPSDQSCRNSRIVFSVHSNSEFVLCIRLSCCCHRNPASRPAGTVQAAGRAFTRLAGVPVGRHRRGARQVTCQSGFRAPGRRPGVRC